MVDGTSSSNPESSDESLQDEVRRLRSQVRQLQADLYDRPRSGRRSPAADIGRSDERNQEDERDRDVARDTAQAFSDLPSRALNEGSKLLRALTFATLEPVRIAGDALNVFADEVFRRNQPERPVSRSREGDAAEERERPTAASLTRDLPGDIYSGFVAAIDEALTIPRRAVDTLYDKYRESDEAGSTQPAREARRERRRAETYERESGRMRQAAQRSQDRASRLDSEEVDRVRAETRAPGSSERGSA